MLKKDISTAVGRALRLLLIIAAAAVLLAAAVSCSEKSTGIDNAFFRRHASECVGLGRQFVVRDDGTSAYSRPGGRKTGRLDAGDVIGIEYYYIDKSDAVWGLTAEGVWLSMEDLELVYDSTAFLDEHEDEINDFEDNEALPEGSRYLWTYPCSGEIIKLDNSPMESIAVRMKYEDYLGRSWLYVTISPLEYGWVCVDAPADPDIEAVDYGKAEIRYFRPPMAPGLWDKLPPHAPYVFIGVSLIVVFETVMTIRKRRMSKNYTKIPLDRRDNKRRGAKKR